MRDFGDQHLFRPNKARLQCLFRVSVVLIILIRRGVRLIVFQTEILKQSVRQLWQTAVFFNF